MGVNNSLGEASGSGSEEENGLGVRLGRGKLEILGALLVSQIINKSSDKCVKSLLRGR